MWDWMNRRIAGPRRAPYPLRPGDAPGVAETSGTPAERDLSARHAHNIGRADNEHPADWDPVRLPLSVPEKTLRTGAGRHRECPTVDGPRPAFNPALWISAIRTLLAGS